LEGSTTFGTANGRARARTTLAARDREIVELRAVGRTLREISQRFGVSHQRIAQIVANAGGPVGDDVTRLRHDADARRATERSAEILELWRRGLRVGEIHQRTGVSWRAIRRTVAGLATAGDRSARGDALLPRRATVLPLFTDEQLIAGVRAVAQRVGHPPTGPEYQQLSGRLRLASHATVYMRFGSWSGVLRAAGFDVAPSARSRPATWGVAECWRALESVADQLGDPPSYNRYRRLSEQRDDLPSAATVRLRLGLWSDTAAALSERRRDKEVAA
jgi:DNA-binding CsgD family transcriptional regulator